MESGLERIQNTRAKLGFLYFGKLSHIIRKSETQRDEIHEISKELVEEVAPRAVLIKPHELQTMGGEAFKAARGLHNLLEECTRLVRHLKIRDGGGLHIWHAYAAINASPLVGTLLLVIGKLGLSLYSDGVLRLRHAIGKCLPLNGVEGVF